MCPNVLVVNVQIAALTSHEDVAADKIAFQRKAAELAAGDTLKCVVVESLSLFSVVLNRLRPVRGASAFVSHLLPVIS
jgi:hypothetical protein